ncbi:MAG: hypothetical protein ACRC5M_04880 [Anaeroplasmataceae bacterium]
MNGSYKPLVEFLDKDTLNKLNEEYEFRTNNFFKKYSDLFINDIINKTKDCKISMIWKEKYWTYPYSILAEDIKIIDPENPSNAAASMSIFFKKCFDVLNVEFKNFTIGNQADGRIEFAVTVFNPLLPKEKE